MAEQFARPLAKLGDSGIGVPAAPSGGMGLALAADGKLPPGVLFVSSLGALRISLGSLTLTFTANAISATITTPHGLGVTPRIWTQPADLGLLATGPLVYVGNIDATNFDCKGQDAGSVARTGSVVVYWLAIG